MEKIMVQKHREQRCKSSSTLLDPKGKEGRSKGGCGAGDAEGQQEPKLLLLDPHGVKRSVSHSWEGETHKASKLTHTEGNLWAPTASKENVNCCPGSTAHSYSQLLPRGPIPDLFQTFRRMFIIWKFQKLVFWFS